MPYMDEYEEAYNRLFHIASNEFWSMMGDVELTPAILEANRNYLRDAFHEPGTYVATERYKDIMRAVGLERSAKELSIA